MKMAKSALECQLYGTLSSYKDGVYSKYVIEHTGL